MVNTKLKNIIKKLILKEADDYLQDFSSFGPDGNDNKNRLRQYLTTKNLSNTSIGPKSLTNFPNKGDELSLFSINVRNLNPVQRAILKQSINNGNINHRIENGVVSFSKKDLGNVLNEIQNLLSEETENLEDAYVQYVRKNGDINRITGNIDENEITKRYKEKIIKELSETQSNFKTLYYALINIWASKYNDDSLDEAYVDKGGQLQDFDFFPYNIKISNDTSPLYNPSLPKINRFEAPDGGVYLQLIVTDAYQKEVLQRALKIAVDKGMNMPDLGGRQRLQNLKYKTFGDTLKVEFSNKYQPLLLNIIEQIRKEDLIKFRQMQNDAYDMQPDEKREQLKIFNSVFEKLIKSIR